MTKYRKLTLDEFRATRKWVPDLADVVPDYDQTPEGQVPIPMPGFTYLEGYYLEHWVDARHGKAPPNGVPTYMLTLHNSSFVDPDLLSLDEKLYLYACHEGGCNVLLPEPTHAEVFDHIDGAMTMMIDGAPMADAGHDLIWHRTERPDDVLNGTLTVDGKRYFLIVYPAG